MDPIERCILQLCEARGPGASICPSEAARALDAEDWRRWLPAVRASAQRLAREGRLRITQSGRAVDLDRLRGPIRLSRPLPSPDRRSTPSSE